MKIGVMGTGGLGGYFGGRLAQAGVDVAFVTRGAQLAAIRANGLQIVSPLGDCTVRPSTVTDDPANIGTVDLVIFSVKAYDAANAADLARPMVGPQTVVIPVLNGVDHIAMLQTALGTEHIMGGVASITAHKQAPGIIEHMGTPGSLEFGELDGSLSPRCDAIGQTLVRGGFAVSAVRNIQERMWRKLVILAGAGLCSVSRVDMVIIFNTPETTALARQAMVEAVIVAQAIGIGLRDSLPDELVLALKDLHGDKPSMFVDLEHGRRLEVASLNGAISRFGRERRIPTPANDFIAACLAPWANGRT
jgi:2-dehydropantoate 2-reductase